LDLFFRKNLRLRICFFFYLFFLDDVWPAAPGSIHNNRARGEVASGLKKAIVEATAHSSSFLHSLHVWRGTQKQRQRRSWKFGMREGNMNVENVCTVRSARWRNAPKSTIHMLGESEREQQMLHSSTRELQQAMSCARRFGKQIIVAFFLSLSPSVRLWQGVSTC